MTGWLAVVVVALLLAVVLQAATGFGFALLAGPSLYSVMAPARAVALLLILGLCVNVLVLPGERRRPAVNWRGLLPAMLAAIPGLPIGAGLVRVLPGDVLRIAIGIIVCSLVARRFLHRARCQAAGTGRSGCDRRRVRRRGADDVGDDQRSAARALARAGAAGTSDLRAAPRADVSGDGCRPRASQRGRWSARQPARQHTDFT